MFGKTFYRFVVAVSPPTIAGKYLIGVRPVTHLIGVKSRISSAVLGNLYFARVMSVSFALEVTRQSRLAIIIIENDLAERVNHDVWKWRRSGWKTANQQPVAHAMEWQTIANELAQRDVIAVHASAATPADLRSLARLRQDLAKKARMGKSSAFARRAS